MASSTPWIDFSIIPNNVDSDLELNFDLISLFMPPSPPSASTSASSSSSPTMPPLINPSTDGPNSEPLQDRMEAANDGANATSTASSTPPVNTGPVMDGSAEGSSSADSTQISPKTVKKSSDESLSDEAKELISRFQATSSMVNITIPSGKTFLVHINLLAEKSSYFRAALTGEFQEAQTKQLTLDDVSDNTFAFFLKWLYAQNLRPADCHTICSHCSECPLSWTELFDLWFFADYTRTPKLQNHIIQNLVQKINNFETACGRSQEPIDQVCAALRMIWKGKKRTAHGEIAKPLRNLLLDFVGNRQYMTKAHETSFRKGPLPYVFWYEFGRRGMDREFDVASKCQRVAAMADPVDDDGDFYEDVEDAFDNLMMAQEMMSELLDVWKIVPETYYVEDGDKAKDAKEEKKKLVC